MSDKPMRSFCQVQAESHTKPQSRESFESAVDEMKDFVSDFCRQHGIDVVFGMAALALEPDECYSAALILAHPGLVPIIVVKLMEGLNKMHSVFQTNEMEKN